MKRPSRNKPIPASQIGKTFKRYRGGVELPRADHVNHPQHYNAHPSGVECITVTEHMNFNVGNAVKYLWRAGIKSDDAITDLEKARWYVEREIARLKKSGAR